MALAYGGRILGVEYREVANADIHKRDVHPASLPISNYTIGSGPLYTNVPMPEPPQPQHHQLQVHPGHPGHNILTDMLPPADHYPTSDGYASPYEGVRSHINRNPFFKSYYDLPADLRTASNPPGDFVVLESQPELRYMLTGPPAQEPTLQPEYGKCLEFQKCRLKITQVRDDDPQDEDAPAVHMSEFLLFDEDGQVIDTGLAVANCLSFGISEDGEEAQRVLDGNPYTKFLRKDCDYPVDVEVDLGIRCKVFSYAWRTGDDRPSRDPISWNFQIFTRHGWATLDQVTLHYVPTKRHTLVGPFRLGSPYDPTVHVDIQEMPRLLEPAAHPSVMSPVAKALQDSLVRAGHGLSPQHAAAQATQQLHDLVHSALPQAEGWDTYHTMVEELLAMQADPNFCDPRGRSTFLKACSEGDGFVIDRLLQCGADPNKQAISGEAPLHRAVLVGNPVNIKLILDAGANPNVQDSQGDTPLNLAVAKMDLAAVKLLLQYHAMKSVRNSKGQLAIDVWEEELRIGSAHNNADATAIRTVLLGEVRTAIHR